MNNLLLILFLGLGIKLSAQVNLVPNPSFEDFNICPDNSGQIANCFGWYSPTTGTPDYYNTCSPNIFSAIPTNTQGFQNPHTGNAYSGIGVMSTPSDFREYLQCNLTSELLPQKYYCISYYVSVNENYINYFIKNIDCYFSNIAINDFINFYPVLNYTPQFTNSQIITDSIAWTKVEGLYLAQEERSI
ncbi:MAG: hypothetical protein M0D57_10395 [Sphingobacteriales bacterium JAD_PAG50586_3]|nr:MAG: hypothetical protein M0D57_10395 [Sphingobacteriales bacterium JAD_PAG50586_3]